MRIVTLLEFLLNPNAVQLRILRIIDVGSYSLSSHSVLFQNVLFQTETLISSHESVHGECLIHLIFNNSSATDSSVKSLLRSPSLLKLSIFH